MKIVLLGSGGQLGRSLAGPLARIGRVVAWSRAEADLERPAAVVDMLQRERPDVIVNAAAHTAVDRAEREPGRARLVNATAVAAIAGAAARTGSWLVHYSTDYVFDGSKSGAYVEDDPPNPLSVYGATKLEGEQAVAAAGCRHWIFRTSWVYAPHGANFIRTILRLARERDRLRIVDDQIGAPTSAALITTITADVIARRAEAAPPPGVYHLAPRGAVSWCGYARHVLAVAGGLGIPLRASAADVEPIATDDYPLPARRPANSRLSCVKLETALNRMMPDWQDDVAPAVVAVARDLTGSTEQAP